MHLAVKDISYFLKWPQCQCMTVVGYQSFNIHKNVIYYVLLLLIRVTQNILQCVSKEKIKKKKKRTIIKTRIQCW